LIFSGARRKDEGLRVKLMLKEYEVGKRRLKQPCGRREFRRRRKLREGKYEYQIDDRNAVLQRPLGYEKSQIDSLKFCCLVYEFSKLLIFKETRPHLHSIDWRKWVPSLVLAWLSHWG
jgi:hypothetical protein